MVNTLSKSITISIRGIISIPRLISGFSTSLKDLINSQQLYALFSRVDYLIFKKPLPFILVK